jgi:NAD(P)-dependent dehydrogenase (short-subunit alcohol dehydrogenase family)
MDLPAAFSLAGRTAFITGSTRGIGAAMAAAFAAAGARVAVHGMDAQAAAQAAARLGPGHVGVGADLGAEDGARNGFAAACAGLGRVDILVLNASLQLPKPWLTATRADFDQQIAINLRSSIDLLQLAAPPMQERGWGRILTIGSVQETRPHPDMLVYSASKCALTGLARSLAKQLAASGVTVNSLAPGAISTDRNKDRLADAAYHAQVLTRIPAGRIGTPEDCSAAALLLCSDAGGYITGQNLYVDGGMSL